MEVHLNSATTCKFLKPGAVHKARRMSKKLYCYKLVLLQDHLPPGVATQSQIKKLERIVQFFIFVFNDWLLNCSVATSVSRQDLTLLQNIMQYKSIDEGVTTSAQKVFLRHTWYMMGEMIPIVLWDEDLLEDERRGLADAIVKLPANSSFELRVGNGWGKPDLALVDISRTSRTTCNGR